MPGPVHHPFASKAQWRLFFASPRLRRWAHQKAHATPSYHALPRRKGRPSFARQAKKRLAG
jgi:hypothetical protein